MLHIAQNEANLTAWSALKKKKAVIPRNEVKVNPLQVKLPKNVLKKKNRNTRKKN